MAASKVDVELTPELAPALFDLRRAPLRRPASGADESTASRTQNVVRYHPQSPGGRISSGGALRPFVWCTYRSSPAQHWRSIVPIEVTPIVCLVFDLRLEAVTLAWKCSTTTASKPTLFDAGATSASALAVVRMVENEPRGGRPVGYRGLSEPKFGAADAARWPAHLTRSSTSGNLAESHIANRVLRHGGSDRGTPIRGRSVSTWGLKVCLRAVALDPPKIEQRIIANDNAVALAA